VKQVADVIKKRLGRELEPYDIWYDGLIRTLFRLNVGQGYPFQVSESRSGAGGSARILVKLGFSADKAAEIAPHPG
jgi:hypothetical protein